MCWGYLLCHVTGCLESPRHIRFFILLGTFWLHATSRSGGDFLHGDGPAVLDPRDAKAPEGHADLGRRTRAVVCFGPLCASPDADFGGPFSVELLERSCAVTMMIRLSSDNPF